jgi:hypothetical protein
LIEKLVLGGEIERELQGTSPIEVFENFVHSKPQSPNPVPHGKRLNRLLEKLVLRGDIERDLQGTSPIEVVFVHSPKPVPRGEKLERLNEIAHRMGISQSKAEKARAESNRFLEVANQADPPEDPPNS